MRKSESIFKGPKAKLRRARDHIADFSKLTSPLCSDWYEIFLHADIRPPAAAPHGYTLRYRPIVDIKENLALIIGDVVHGLRSALDLLASGIRGDAKGFFPLREERRHLFDQAGQPIQGIKDLEAALPGSTALILEILRPEGAVNDILWSFVKLSNDDKHNTLLPTLSITNVKNINARVGGGVMSNLSVRGNAMNTLNLISYDKVFKFDRRCIVETTAYFTEETPFAGREVISSLNEVADLVKHTITEFERLMEARR